MGKSAPDAVAATLPIRRPGKGDAPDKRPPNGEAATLAAPPPSDTLRARAEAFAAGWSETERYTLVRELASGGGGRIAVAIDRKLGRRVALKRAHDSGGEARLEREALVLARLEHPAIVPIHDAGHDPAGAPYYAMKLLGGADLAARIAAARTFEARVAMLPVVATVADAVAYAHSEGVIHRDLKPGNVLVGDFGEVVVIDWGLGKVLAGGVAEAAPTVEAPAAAAALTRDGSVMGTPAYMAPEQAAGREVDERADVYALGAMLDHVLTGEVPYGDALDSEATLVRLLAGPPPPITEREPRVPRDLAAIVDKAMARDPTVRYPSARELAEDLRRYQAGRLVAAHRYPPWTRAWRWVRRHRAALAGGLAAVAIGGAAFVVMSRDAPAAACTGLDAPVRTAWNPERRAAIERAFRASGVAHAEASLTAVVGALDRQATAIAAMRIDACEAARTRREQTEAIMEARMQCLDRRTSEVATLADVLAGADAAVVKNARRTLATLGRVEDCADVERLRDLVPLPAAPAARAEVLAVMAELDEITALDAAGRNDAWIARVEPAVARAGAAGWAPAHARALGRWANVLIWRGQLDDAVATLRRAIAVADRGHDDASRARALNQLAGLELIHRQDLDQAARVLDEAEAAAERAGDLTTQASLEVYRGRLAHRRGKLDEAVVHLEAAVALERRVPGNPVETERPLGEIYLEAGRLDDGERAMRSVIARLTAAYGTDQHPEIAAAIGGLGSAAYLRGDLARAIELTEQEVAIYTKTSVSYLTAFTARMNLAAMKDAIGRSAEAAAQLEPMVAECDAKLESRHGLCRTARFNLASALARDGKRDAALAGFRDALARLEKLDPAEVPEAAAEIAEIRAEIETLQRVPR